MPSLAALESLAAASPVPAPATQSVHDEDGPSRRLADVSRKFSQFYSDLEIEKQRRSEQELGRRNALFDQVQRLEVDVLAETRRRREHEVAFRDAMVSDLRATETRLESKFDALSTELRQAMDILQKQFHEIREGLREERTQRRIDVEQLGELVVERVEAVEASIDDERVARLERETVVLKRVGEDVRKISEKVDEESAHREKGLEMIQSDIARLQDKESTASDSFQNAVLSEIQNVKRALNEEQQERIGEDARIIDAVNDYTRVMQEGLRLVNRG